MSWSYNPFTNKLDKTLIPAEVYEKIAFNDLSDMPGGDISVGKVTYTSLDPAIPTPTLDLVLTAGDTSASNNLTLTNGTLTADTLTDGTATLTGGELLDLATIEATTTLGFEIGDVQQLVLTDGKLNPTTDDDVQIGDATHRISELHLMPTSLYLGTTHLTQARYKNTETNTALNGFRIAVNGSLSIFNMIDGVVDEYEDESGIDTATSTNEYYDGPGAFYTISQGNLGTNLVSRWKLNDNAANTNVNDDVGSNDGTLLGGDYTQDITVAGPTDTTPGFAFNGIDDAISVGDLTDGWNQLTVSAWFNSNVEGDQNAIVSEYQTAGDRNFQITIRDTDEIAYIICSSDNTCSIITTVNSPISTNTWYHASLTYDGTTAIAYLNGEVVGTDTVASGALDTTSQPFQIGRRGTVQYFDGSIDEVRVYNRALTQAEITALYNSGDGTESISVIDAVENMTLISEPVTAEAEPDTARIVILEEDVDAVTINTDLKAYASRDDGSTWDEITLADDGDYNSDIRILTGEIALTSTGTDMVYKIATDNDKVLKIHGTALTWD